MNSCYKLACALVAWSALSLTAQAASFDALTALPNEAYLSAPDYPDRYLYRLPGIDLSAYHGVLIEPLVLLGQQQGDWTLQIAAQHSAPQRQYRAHLEQQLQQRGIAIASAPGPGVLRLRVALACDEPLLGCEPQSDARFNLETLASGVDHYLAWVSTIAQVEDSQSGQPLVGSVDLKNSPAQHRPLDQEHLSVMLEGWASAAATRLAQAIG